MKMKTENHGWKLNAKNKEYLGCSPLRDKASQACSARGEMDLVVHSSCPLDLTNSSQSEAKDISIL